MISADEKQNTQKRKILIFENSYTLSEHLLKLWLDIAQESVQRSNRFTVALCGGRSPMEFYCKLSNFSDFELWKNTHVFMGDERFVPFDDNKSNFKMIKENLLDFVNIPSENIHPIPTDQSKVELSAEQYKDELGQFFDSSKDKAPSFDFILLGLGLDGHSVSLFADDPNVKDVNRLTIPVSLPHLKEERVSITLPVINNAKNVIMLVLGAKKAEIFEQIIKEKSSYPASQIDLMDGQVTYLLDKEAAQRLSYHESYTHEGEAICFTP